MTAILLPPGTSYAEMVGTAKTRHISQPRYYDLTFDPSYTPECNRRLLQAFGLNSSVIHYAASSGFLVILDSSHSSRPEPKLSSSQDLIHPKPLPLQDTGLSPHIALVTEPSRLDLISALLSSCDEIVFESDSYPFSSRVQQPLPGTCGWDSFEQLFTFLSKAVVWCLLRNYEYHLEGSFWERDKDLDILSPKLDLLICACNAVPRYGGISSYRTTVEGRCLNLDLRYIGDKYYDPAWTIDILRTRVLEKHNIYRPSDDHYLYMLIYHALLQKSHFSGHYQSRIKSLSSDLNIPWKTESLGPSDFRELLLKTLDSFLQQNNYVYTYTADSYVNTTNVNRLSSLENQTPGVLLKPLFKRLFQALAYRLAWKLRNLFDPG